MPATRRLARSLLLLLLMVFAITLIIIPPLSTSATGTRTTSRRDRHNDRELGSSSTGESAHPMVFKRSKQWSTSRESHRTLLQSRSDHPFTTIENANNNSLLVSAPLSSSQNNDSSNNTSNIVSSISNGNNHEFRLITNPIWSTVVSYLAMVLIFLLIFYCHVWECLCYILCCCCRHPCPQQYICCCCCCAKNPSNNETDTLEGEDMEDDDETNVEDLNFLPDAVRLDNDDGTNIENRYTPDYMNRRQVEEEKKESDMGPEEYL